jgi:hypothetical protein
MRENNEKKLSMVNCQWLIVNEKDGLGGRKGQVIRGNNISFNLIN